MLKIAKLIDSPSVHRLLNLWVERYIPNISTLSFIKNGMEITQTELLKTTTPEGRALTLSKLNEALIELKNYKAILPNSSLYAYIPNIVNLAEAKRLTHFAFLVYKRLIEIYQNLSYSIPSQNRLCINAGVDNLQDYFDSWVRLSLEELAITIAPLLLEYKVQHIASKDWRTLGFITTLINFTNQLMFSNLTDLEQALIKPYFMFIEEQIAIPWQRVCAAAASYQLDSPAFILVEKMLPLSDNIAQAVYQKLVTLLPHHRSRRGGLDNPEIAHSCLRDLQMFQSYLWLCLLEESMTPIEQELVDLCVMVMPGINVKWEMAELWNKLLADEILSRITSSQKQLLKPYTQGLQQAFEQKRHYFIEPLNSLAPPLNLHPLKMGEKPDDFYFPAGIPGKPL
jgi:hypothetical protein